MLERLRAFLGRGGKLIVFGSSSAALARLMDLELGTYAVSHQPGRWAAMRFNTPSDWGAPERVYETAWSLVPARPAGDGAEVIAQWESADGQGTGDPACLSSPGGFWFCHLPRGDDPQGKRELLLALVGRYQPELRRTAAKHALAQAGRIGPHPDLPSAFAHVRARTSGGARTRAEAQLDRVAALHRNVAGDFAAGRYQAVIREAPAVSAQLALAYTMTSRGKHGEIRGVWDHDGVGLFPGDWDRTCELLAARGVTAILPNHAWGGLAHYPSRILPRSNTHRLHGDQLQQCVRAAARHGLEVHVWKVCWNMGNAPAAFRDRLQDAGRLQRDEHGASQPWLCPSHPENRRQELDALKEMARDYPIDGVHLDYIRYPGPDACFCAGCRARFQQQTAVKVSAWPGEVREKGRFHRQFLTWRADQITALVHDVSREVRAVRPGLRVSAAVFRSYPSCRDSVGQDWKTWLDRGYVDFVCPMNYTESAEGFRATTRLQRSVAGNAGRLAPGIGVLSGESQLGAAETAAQVVAARELQTAGFVFFDLSPTLMDDVLPYLGFPATTTAGR
jgi:uncharacterized lipoprotein YddW (UPF0748 family)